MIEVFICDYICIFIGCFGGSLVLVWVDDLGVVLLCVLMVCNQGVDWQVVDDVVFGCVNQVGEDNCNVVCMLLLLVGLLLEVLGIMINWFCGLGMDVVLVVVCQIMVGQVDLMIVGGVELMLCVFFVMFKVESVYLCVVEIYDIIIGWCFVNLVMVKVYGVDLMLQIGQNVVDDYGILCEVQDVMVLVLQVKVVVVQVNGCLVCEIILVSVLQCKGDLLVVDCDEYFCVIIFEVLVKLCLLFDGGSVIVGNVLGVNDGVVVLIFVIVEVVKKYGLIFIVCVLGGVMVGVLLCIMGIGFVFVSQKLLVWLGLMQVDFDVIELNEVFVV